jgi:threonine dehydratase
MSERFSIEDVQAAARRLLHRIHRTPVVSCQSVDDASGYQVFFKCENLQRAGAFKIRGALNKLLTLGADERARGVVAFSSGNHAQGVALAARLVGTTAVICMPKDAPRLKLEATRNYGADVVFYDRHRDDREAVARKVAAETNRILVPPYDDYAIMAGQGTAALELFEDVPSVAAVSWPAARPWRAASSPVCTSSASRRTRPTTRISRCARVSGSRSRRRRRSPTGSASPPRAR